MNKRKQGRRQIALLIETSNAYARGLLKGINAYVREHQTWSMYLGEHSRGAPVPRWLKNWKGDGLIARIENRGIARVVAALNMPTVDVSSARMVPALPWVETDDEAFAQRAAEHLMERGFKNLAFCGVPGFNWSRWRGEHFLRMLEGQGFDVSSFPAEVQRASSENPDREMKRLAKWLKGLPKPLGVWSAYDIRGRQVLEACRYAGLSVPEEVAVLGCDNDELLCEFSDPPLSSVIPDSRRTGYEAAALLDALLSGPSVSGPSVSGPSVSGRGVLIPPLGIATRLSTDVTATPDREVAKAVRFIREHACDGINVQDVLERVNISRRALEVRFKNVIGRTPHEELLRIRLERVKTLLRETDRSMAVIADRAGFMHPEYMSVVFKQKLGLPPSAYRAQLGKYLDRSCL